MKRIIFIILFILQTLFGLADYQLVTDSLIESLPTMSTGVGAIDSYYAEYTAILKIRQRIIQRG